MSSPTTTKFSIRGRGLVIIFDTTNTTARVEFDQTVHQTVTSLNAAIIGALQESRLEPSDFFQPYTFMYVAASLFSGPLYPDNYYIVESQHVQILALLQPAANMQPETLNKCLAADSFWAAKITFAHISTKTEPPPPITRPASTSSAWRSVYIWFGLAAAAALLMAAWAYSSD